MYITASLCCTPETNTTLLISYTPRKTKEKKNTRKKTMAVTEERLVGELESISNWRSGDQLEAMTMV